MAVFIFSRGVGNEGHEEEEMKLGREMRRVGRDAEEEKKGKKFWQS